MYRVLIARTLLLAIATLPAAARAQQNRETNRPPTEVLAASFRKLVDMIDRPEDAPPKTFYMMFEIRKAEGVARWFHELNAKIALQLPDRAWLSADMGDKSYSFCRNKQQLWIHSAAKEFGVLGERGRALFAEQPDNKDQTELGPITLPLRRDRLLTLPFLMEITKDEMIDLEEMRCRRLTFKPRKEAIETFKLPDVITRVWLDTNDLPLRIHCTRENPKLDLLISPNNIRLDDPWPEERWQLPKGEGQEVERTALKHLVRYVDTGAAKLLERNPPLGKITGERKVLATAGWGRLELIDGARVMFLRGTPEQMGRQHGTLLKAEIQETRNRLLYGLGVGLSLDKGKWVITDMASAHKDLSKFMEPDYLAEMNALAQAAEVDPHEIYLANTFQELLHCSTFAVYGKATASGKLYHGRVLDFLRGAGVEKGAVVMVMQPQGRNTWVNIGYAGLIGSVTAMNDKRLAIGEMAGTHPREWEGKPMAELVREVMERASTIEEALEIMKKTPRTCDYYYVISDGKIRKAVAVRATVTKFEVIEAGKKHDKFPDPVRDTAVVAPAEGKRYEELIKRIKEKDGKLDSDQVWELMKPPVAMDSNIQTVLFVPETLDFRVANSNSDKVASEAPFRKYNLMALLGRTNEMAAIALPPEKEKDPNLQATESEKPKPEQGRGQRRRRP